MTTTREYANFRMSIFQSIPLRIILYVPTLFFGLRMIKVRPEGVYANHVRIYRQIGGICEVSSVIQKLYAITGLLGFKVKRGVQYDN